ncbi:hypothetical protein, partial [Clostridium botulinum]|uniref:hypothetical protein n=1 Tax=Clostridium botulinum TaxID=1491 RepID=UPI0009CFEB70
LSRDVTVLYSHFEEDGSIRAGSQRINWKLKNTTIRIFKEWRVSQNKIKAIFRYPLSTKE